MGNSDGWNCMADIETDKNLVQTMAEVIIRNTSNASERQDFWESATRSHTNTISQAQILWA
jgi:type IV secretion system protein VirD4